MKTELEPIGRSIVLAGKTTGVGIANRHDLTDAELADNDRVFQRCSRVLGWEWADNTLEMMDRLATAQVTQGRLVFDTPEEKMARTKENVRGYAVARGLEPYTMQVRVLVADFYPHAQRRAALSFHHHVEAWRLGCNLQKATAFLARAEAEQWSVSQLRAAIRQSSALPEVKEPEIGDELPRELSQFESWAAERWTDYQKVAPLDAIRILGELTNAVRLVDHLRATAEGRA